MLTSCSHSAKLWQAILAAIKAATRKLFKDCYVGYALLTLFRLFCLFFSLPTSPFAASFSCIFFVFFAFFCKNLCWLLCLRHSRIYPNELSHWIYVKNSLKFGVFQKLRSRLQLLSISLLRNRDLKKKTSALLLNFSCPPPLSVSKSLCYYRLTGGAAWRPEVGVGIARLVVPARRCTSRLAQYPFAAHFDSFSRLRVARIESKTTAFLSN